MRIGISRVFIPRFNARILTVTRIEGPLRCADDERTSGASGKWIISLKADDQRGGGKKYHRFGAQYIRVIRAIRESAFYRRDD